MRLAGLTGWFMTSVRSRLVRSSGSDAEKTFHHRGTEGTEKIWRRRAFREAYGAEPLISNLKFEIKGSVTVVKRKGIQHRGHREHAENLEKRRGTAVRGGCGNW